MGKEKLRASKSGKERAKQRSVSTTTAATDNNEVPFTLGYTLVTSAHGDAAMQISHVVDEHVEECYFERLNDFSD